MAVDEAQFNSEFIAHAREDIPALCATVKALRATEQAVLQRASKYCDRPDDMPISAIVNVAFNVLEDRLSEVERELKITKQHRDDLIAEPESKK